MPHELKPTENGAEVTLSAQNREELFREALAATLEASYSGVPALGEYEGQVVPIQAVGMDDAMILGELVRDCLREVHIASATLHAPKWLAFDAKRVTANLPTTTPGTKSRELVVRSATTTPGAAGLSARIVFEAGGGH